MEIPDIYSDIFQEWCKDTHTLMQKMLDDIDYYSLKVDRDQVIFTLICSIYDFEQANKKNYSRIEKTINHFNDLARELHEREDNEKD